MCMCIYVCMYCVHTHVHMCVCSLYVAVRGQLEHVGSLLPSCGFSESNSGIRFDHKCLYPLNHLTHPYGSFLLPFKRHPLFSPRNRMAKKVYLFRFQRETRLCFYPQKMWSHQKYLSRGCVSFRSKLHPQLVSLALLITSEPAPITCVFPQIKSSPRPGQN